MNVPKHVAIIPDGNRRWAIRRKLGAQLGHKEGGDRVVEITRTALTLGLETLTFYFFSTENWKRSSIEIRALFWLYERMLRLQQKFLMKEGIRFETIGVLEPLPSSLKKVIQETKEKTKEGENLTLVAALNYGGRDEIIRSIQKMIKLKLDPDKIDENTLSKYLDTAPFGEPELLIRTSGESRISNFLIWQAAYSEFYLSSLLWPDFKGEDFAAAIEEYRQRSRRLGK